MGLNDEQSAERSIKGVSMENGIGLERFRGILRPGEPEASATNCFRFHSGKILERWDSFEIEN